MPFSHAADAPRRLSALSPVKSLTSAVTRGAEHLNRLDGFKLPQLFFIFVVAALACFSRCPSLLLKPQFYGEDGAIWYVQAYETGWLHSLTMPFAGYLSSLQRVGAGVSLLVPFRQAPLVMALIGLTLQCVPVPVLLSNRCQEWGPLSLRLLWAFLYVSLPNTQEVHIVLTNSQWHLPLAALLIGFVRPANNVAWRTFDVVTVTLVGLTGPYCLLLLPLLVIYYIRCHYRWTLVLGGITAICSGAQAWFLTHNNNRILSPLGVTLFRFVRIFGGNVIAGTLLGGDHHMAFQRLSLLFLTTLFGLFIFVYTLCKANIQLRLLVGFSLLLLAGSLKSPLVGEHPRWEGLIFIQYSRYWFFPMLAFIWCVAWCCWNANEKAFRGAAAAWLCLSIIGIGSGWRLHPYPDVDFPDYARQFEAASPGTVLAIPEVPAGTYTMRIRKH